MVEILSFVVPAVGVGGLGYTIYRVHVRKVESDAETSMGGETWKQVVRLPLRVRRRMKRTFSERVRTTRHLYFKSLSSEEAGSLAHEAVANAYRVFAKDRLDGLLPDDDWEQTLREQIRLEVSGLERVAQRIEFIRARMEKTFSQRVRSTQDHYFKNRADAVGRLMAHKAVANAYELFDQDLRAGKLPGDDWEQILDDRILHQASAFNALTAALEPLRDPVRSILPPG